MLLADFEQLGVNWILSFWWKPFDIEDARIISANEPITGQFKRLWTISPKPFKLLKTKMGLWKWRQSQCF
jgi:hypothetical protein